MLNYNRLRCISDGELHASLRQIKTRHRKCAAGGRKAAAVASWFSPDTARPGQAGPVATAAAGDEDEVPDRAHSDVALPLLSSAGVTRGQGQRRYSSELKFLVRTKLVPRRVES